MVLANDTLISVLSKASGNSSNNSNEVIESSIIGLSDTDKGNDSIVESVNNRNVSGLMKVIDCSVIDDSILRSINSKSNDESFTGSQNVFEQENVNNQKD